MTAVRHVLQRFPVSQHFEILWSGLVVTPEIWNIWEMALGHHIAKRTKNWI